MKILNAGFRLCCIFIFLSRVSCQSLGGKGQSNTSNLKQVARHDFADLETCFSPDENCKGKLLEFVSSAHESLDMAVFDINIEELLNLVVTMSQRTPTPVNIRIVVDKVMAGKDKSLVSKLREKGLHIKYGCQKGYFMHNKFSIVDGKTLETGSFNYTNHASLNQENQIYLSNPVVVERYKLRFEKMWMEADDSKTEKDECKK